MIVGYIIFIIIFYYSAFKHDNVGIYNIYLHQTYTQYKVNILYADYAVVYGKKLGTLLNIGVNVPGS